MGELVVIVLFALIVVVVKAAGARSYAWLTSRGTPARGILLQVDSTGVGIEGLRMRGIQRRGVLIDVEVTGRAPYTVAASIYIPRTLVRDVLPGATVELRIDPRNQSNIAVIGPGSGFAPALLTQRQS
jgi:hypothetical protein